MARLISSTTRGLRAFHGAQLSPSLEPVTSGNLLDHLQCPLPASQSKHTVQLFRKSSLHSCHRRVVGDDRNFHVCFHPLQQPGRRLLELSKVASNNETPLRPGHAVGSTVQVTVSAENHESPNFSHVDTGWTCFHHLLRNLSSSTTCSSFRNQRFLRLSQTVFLHK